MTKDGENRRFIIDTHSPYYLHPSEGPSVLITAKIFDGGNYYLWVNAVQTTLNVKIKIVLIDGP